MKSFTVRTLLVFLTCSAIAFAQKTGGGSTGSTGTPTGPTGSKGTTTSIPTTTMPTRNIPPVQQPQMPIFLTGRVVMDDGTAPPERVAVERVCNGRAWKEGYTDSKGYFSITIGGGVNTTLQDASTSDGDASMHGMPGMNNGMSSMGGGMNTGGLPNTFRLFGCELRGSLAGAISEHIELSDHQNMGDPNVGTIVLHRIGKVDGTSVSVTSLQAPKEARKAFDHARKELKKKQFDKAKAELTHAVELYPNYAEAWSLLGEVELHDQNQTAAIDDSQKAIAADSHFISPYFTLITASANQKDWKNTEAYSDKLLSLDAYHFPAAYYYSALACLQMGNLEKAQTSIMAARKYDVGSTIPKSALLMGDILMQRENYAGAAQAYKDYLVRVPTGTSADYARNQLNAAQTKLAAAAPPPPAAGPK